MASRLEELPNELLWFIMEYVPPIDLFQAFYNLNQRLNTILHLIHFRFNLLYTNKIQFNYFLHQILPNIEPNWIESFHIDDISHRFQSIELYQNLRSLAIYHLHTENIALLAKNILPKLIQLNFLRLHSEFILKEWDVDVLTDVIFSEAMPSLSYCYLAFQDFGRMSFDHLDITKKSLSLKTLVIDQWCRLRDFIRLLHYIPNIRRLTVRLFDSNIKNTIAPSLTAIDDFTILVPHLIYFRAKLSQISWILASQVLFLRLPSQLQELSLSTWSIEYGNGDSWESLLSTRFPHLKHFRLIISLDQIPANHSISTQADLDHLVQSFNQSKYFLDHHWHVLVNINERDRLKFVLHTVPYPIENFQSTLYNIRRCTSTSTLTKSAYSNVRKLTLTLQDDYASDSIEHRSFPNVDQLTFLSNLADDCQQFESIEYFNHLKNLINLSKITSLHFPEETHQYPIQLMHILLNHLPQLHSLTLPHRLYVCLKPQSIQLLKTVTLIFTMYSSISPPATRMRHLLPSNQILTNELIVELVRTFSSFSLIQTLTLIVRDLDGFDDQFPEWLKKTIFISSDFFSPDKIVRFYF